MPGVSPQSLSNLGHFTSEQAVGAAHTLRQDYGGQ